MTKKEITLLRKSGINTFHELSAGNSYLPMGGGITSAGTSMMAMQTYVEMIRMLNDIKTNIRANVKYFVSHVEPKGHPFRNRSKFVFVCRRYRDEIRFYDVVNNNFLGTDMESKNFKRTLRHIKMVMAEKNNRELLWTEKRIAYNNTWPKEGKWYSDVQQMLDEWLKEQGITQIFEPVKLSEGARDILFPNAKLNKVFSGIVDIYDELPYRPDEGFDIAWRSLEIFMNHHRSIAWPKDNDKATHLMLRTVKELIMPLVNKDLRVKEMWKRFLNEIPISVLRFAIMRCFIQHD